MLSIEILAIYPSLNQWKWREIPFHSRFIKPYLLFFQLLISKKWRFLNKIFKRILVSGAQARQISFEGWEIDSLDVILPSHIRFGMEELKFMYCEKKSNWSEHPNKVISILKMIETCNLSKPLKRLYLNNRAIKVNKIGEIMKDSTLTSLDIF